MKEKDTTSPSLIPGMRLGIVIGQGLKLGFSMCITDTTNHHHPPLLVV